MSYSLYFFYYDTGVDHIIVFTAAEDPRLPPHSNNNSNPALRIHQRTYHVQLKKNPDAAVKAPAAFLSPCGPDFDYVLRRTAWADPELAAAARQQPASLKARKKKNQSTNLFGETIGRLHLERQNVDHMGGRKVKAIRRAEQAEKKEERAALEDDLEREKEAMGQEFASTFGFAEEEGGSNKRSSRNKKRQQQQQQAKE